MASTTTSTELPRKRVIELISYLIKHSMGVSWVRQASEEHVKGMVWHALYTNNVLHNVPFGGDIARWIDEYKITEEDVIPILLDLCA